MQRNLQVYSYQPPYPPPKNNPWAPILGSPGIKLLLPSAYQPKELKPQARWAGVPLLPRNLEAADVSTPWRPRDFSVQKLQNLFVNFTYKLQKGEDKQMQAKFQPFYSKQLLTMYKYCILAHMKNTTSKAPRNVFTHVTGPFTKRVYSLL